MLTSTLSGPIYVAIFDWAHSFFFSKTGTYRNRGLKQVIDIYVVINHLIKGKIES